jgi:hypothetical protein
MFVLMDFLSVLEYFLLLLMDLLSLLADYLPLWVVHSRELVQDEWRVPYRFVQRVMYTLDRCIKCKYFRSFRVWGANRCISLLLRYLPLLLFIGYNNNSKPCVDWLYKTRKTYMYGLKDRKFHHFPNKTFPSLLTVVAIRPIRLTRSPLMRLRKWGNINY